MNSNQRTILHSGALTLLVASLPACGGQLLGWPTPGDCDDTGGDPVPDEVAPKVRWTTPVDEGLAAAPNGVIVAVFNEEMDPTTLTQANFSLQADGATIAGVLTQFGSNTLSFAPNVVLETETVYTATISTDVTDLAGNAMAEDFVWTFTTSDTLDTTAPYVILTHPTDLSPDVPLDATVNATFSEAMDPLSLTETRFTLFGPGSTVVAGALSYDLRDQTLSFTPDAALLGETVYSATVDMGAMDLAGNGMDSHFTWSFTTTEAPSVWLPVELGSLSTFVAVAGAGLTNSNSSGTTTLNGDVGLNPGGSCLGDGVPCTALNPVVNGTLYINDIAGVAAQAKTDLTAAYVDGMARPSGTPVSDLAGMVLAPGVYTSASGLGIAVDGVVTLDGEGDPDAVWIFQVGSSLSVQNNVQVLLINGARASNVFWVVFGSTTVGTDVNFQGSVLAGASVSVGTDSVVVGRLLCRDGGVTLLSNDLTLPPLFE